MTIPPGRFSLLALVVTIMFQYSSAAAQLVVGNPLALVSALAESRSGDRILVLAGTYDLDEPLHVPDGVTLAGEGIMEFDDSGLPTGIVVVNRTTLRSTATLSGDVVTLGNGAGLFGLVVEDAAGRAGNVVVVSSRRSNDSVAAWMSQCEIINPNPALGSPRVPIGRGVILVTQNLNLAADPPPHEGSEIWLSMHDSVVRAPGGGGSVMALNFASRSRITALLSGNVLGGVLDSAAAASKPDEVSDSSVTIVSARNLYRSDSAVPTTWGWLLAGGTDAPMPGLAAEATRANQLRMWSLEDRIEGFSIGIYARAGRRNSPIAGAIAGNEITINATHLKLATTTSDLLLYGDFSFVNGMPAGDDNVLHLVLRGATGSGARSNQYVHSSTQLGSGNRLVLSGNSIAFQRTNSNISPPPPAQFFTSGR